MGAAGPRFERRVVVIAPGAARDYDAAEWRDAIVMVQRGEIEVEGRSGGRRRFGPGAVVWLDGLPLRAVHAVGAEAAALVSVRRSGGPGSSGRRAGGSRPRRR
jgi:hypothetical protein